MLGEPYGNAKSRTRLNRTELMKKAKQWWRIVNFILKICISVHCIPHTTPQALRCKHKAHPRLKKRMLEAPLMMTAYNEMRNAFKRVHGRWHGLRSQAILAHFQNLPPILEAWGIEGADRILNNYSSTKLLSKEQTFSGIVVVKTCFKQYLVTHSDSH